VPFGIYFYLLQLSMY